MLLRFIDTDPCCQSKDWGAKVGFDNSFGTQTALLVFATLIMAVLHVYGPRLRLKRGLLKL